MILILLLLLFGIYHRLSSSTVIRLFAQLYCISFGVSNVVSTIVFSLEADTAMTLYSVLLTVESVVYILLSLIFQEDIITKFPLEISSHMLILSDSKDIESYAPYFMVLASIIGRIIYMCVSDYQMVRKIFIVTHVLRHTTCYFGRFEAVGITDTYRKAIKALKDALEDQMDNKKLTDEDKAVYIKTFLQVYKKITDYLYFTNVFRFKIIFGFVCDFLKIMFVLYYIISINSFFNYVVVPWLLEIIMHVSIIFTSVLLMDMAAGDIDDVKHIIANQLLLYKDQKLKIVLYDALEYINIRSENVLWNKFPMDLSLVFDFISTCSIYIIALLQFIY